MNKQSNSLSHHGCLLDNYPVCFTEFVLRICGAYTGRYNDIINIMGYINQTEVSRFEFGQELVMPYKDMAELESIVLFVLKRNKPSKM